MSKYIVIAVEPTDIDLEVFTEGHYQWKEFAQCLNLTEATETANEFRQSFNMVSIYPIGEKL